MDVKIIFTINTVNYLVPWEVQHNLDKLRIKLKRYISKKQNGILFYEISENDVLYSEVLTLKDSYDRELELKTQFEASYTKDELDKAVAFIPDFDKIQLEEYGDDNLTHLEICEKCRNSKMREKLIANPDGKNKVLINEEHVIKCGEQIDEVYGISKFMFDNIKDSYLKKGFKPIYSKRGKEPFGYGFYGESEVQLYNDNFCYEEPCKYCGTVYAEEKKSVEHYCEFYVLQKIDFKESPVYNSSQFYNGNQIALISPDLYKYIKCRVKDAKFIPVFVSEL